MNKHELRTVRQEAERFTKGIKIIELGDVLKLELPYLNDKDEALYFFISKRKGSKKFSLLIPVESVGLVALNTTLSILQPLLKTYNLILTQDAVITEESNLPLNQRLRNLTQAIIGIDGICRLWKVEFNRRTDAKSKDTESVSDTTNSSTSR